MADYFDSAQANNTQSQAALLQAIATQGSQAKAAFDQANQQISAQRTQALAAAVAEAAQRGAPQAVQDQTTGTISSGYDRRLADLASAQASNAGSIANISSRGQTYLTEANAAIPALRSRQDLANTTAATTVANRLASLKSTQDLATQAADRQERQFEQTQQDRKDAQAAAAANAQQAAQDRQDRLDQQARVDAIQFAIAQTNLGKADVSGQTASDKAATAAQTAADKAAAKQQQQAFDTGQAPPATTKQIATVGKIATAAAKPGGIAAGANYSLPSFGAPNIATAAAGSGALAAKTGANPDLGPTQVSAAAIKAVSTTRAYKDALAAAKAAHAAGLTADQLSTQMQAGMVKDYGHDFPQTRDVVVRMFQSGQA